MVTRRVLSLAVNLLVAAVVFWAWGRVVFARNEQGMLSSRGLASLKYFTVLSNLFAAVASLIYAVCQIRALAGGAGVPQWCLLLKYAATVSVGLTFAVVMAFLGPVYGYANMFQGSNFWFHLIVPLVCAAQWVLLDRDGSLPFRAVYAAMLPMLLYAVGYVTNLLIHGISQHPNPHDWYGFAVHGVPGACLSFVLVTLATFALSVLLRLPHMRG